MMVSLGLTERASYLEVGRRGLENAAALAESFVEHCAFRTRHTKRITCVGEEVRWERRASS